MSESILYYPNIDIQDGPWLRSAALYWDEVCSIVPDENYADFSPELMYLQERGYYRPIYPGDIFVLGDPREFSNAVKHHFASLLRGNLFSLARANKPGYRSRGNKRRIYSPHITSLIHYRKIPEQIIDLFVDSDVVVVRHDGWLEMDEAFANRYMKLLAEFVTIEIVFEQKEMVADLPILSLQIKLVCCLAQNKILK